jgi:hypothetical protein
MRRIVCALFIAAIAGTLAPALSAQWPSRPTPGVPRNAKGEPNLNAPAPRAPDGKPDLTGIWENTGWDQLSGGVGGAAGAPLASGALPTGPNLFRDIGVGVKGGLPLRPEAAALKKKRMTENSKDNPDAHCLPMGNMQFHMHPQPRKMIQTPSLLLLLYEGNEGIRQINLDGRPLPPNDEVHPWWYGYSTGRWEGDTLVVQTSNFRDGGWLDINGSPLTDAAKMTERFRRVNFGTLEISVTIDDPKAYTRPWTVSFRQRLMLDTELIEFVCLENEKSTRYFDK